MMLFIQTNHQCLLLVKDVLHKSAFAKLVVKVLKSDFIYSTELPKWRPENKAKKI